MQVAHAMNHVLEEANKRLKVPLSSLWKGRKVCGMSKTLAEGWHKQRAVCKLFVFCKALCF